MRKAFKIILVFILMISPCLSLEAPIVDASSPSPESDFEWRESNEEAIITNYRGSDKDVVIPDTINGLTVTGLGDRKSGWNVSEPLFRDKGIKSVIIPDSVTIIGGHAFRDNQLTSIEIPNSVTEIGYYAFRDNQLTSAEIPNSVTEIGDDAFSGNQLTNIEIPNSVTEIGEYAFSNNQLTSIEIPNSVTEIGYYAFSGNQLTNIEIPKNIKIINAGLFSGNKLESVIIPKHIEEIEASSFSMSSLKEVVIKNKDISIETLELDFLGIVNFLTPFTNQLYPEQGANRDNLILIGFKDSTTENFAKEHSFNFVDIEGKVSFSKNDNPSWEKSHSTKVNVAGYDNKKPLEYTWSTSASTPSSGWTDFTNGANITHSSGTGNYYLHVRGTNLLGESFNKRSNVFRIDNTAPSAPSISGSTSWRNSNQSITITHGTDSDSGVDYSEYRTRLSNGSWSSWTRYSSAFTISSNGETHVQARTRDKAGNISNVVSKTVKVDKVKPSLTITPNTTSTTHEDITLTARGSDSHSGVKRIKLPNNTWVNGSSATYTVEQNGTFTFTVEDNAGNTTNKSITVNNIDKTSSFENPNISGFSSVTLSNKVQTITTDVSPIVIKDWRDTSNKWRLDVSANPLTSGSHSLPKGSLQLKEVSDIERINGSGSTPTKGYNSTQVIDNGKITVAQSDNARGEYKIHFPNNALEVLVDPTTAKTGKYESTITWEFVNAP